MALAVFFSVILAAWAIIAVMQVQLATDQLSNGAILNVIASICVSDVRDASLFSSFLMWGLMSIGMMAPTAIPAFKTFDDLKHTSAVGNVDFFALILGYLSVWLVFSIFAAVFQHLLAGAEMLDFAGRSINLWLNAILLLTAGGYQFSMLKNACLTRCRNPLTYFIENWREGIFGSFKLGLGLGAICVGCCWALMALAFVGGIMSLAWMAAAMVLMTTEKLPDPGRFLTRPLGVVLLAGGVVTVLIAL